MIYRQTHPHSRPVGWNRSSIAFPPTNVHQKEKDFRSSRRWDRHTNGEYRGVRSSAESICQRNSYEKGTNQAIDQHNIRLLAAQKIANEAVSRAQKHTVHRARLQILRCQIDKLCILCKNADQIRAIEEEDSGDGKTNAGTEKNERNRGFPSSS